MKRVVSLALACALVLAGCCRKEKKPSARCIYDQPPIAEACRAATADVVAFEKFKQNPYLNLLWENVTEEEGRIEFQRIEREYPFF